MRRQVESVLGVRVKAGSLTRHVKRLALSSKTQPCKSLWMEEKIKGLVAYVTVVNSIVTQQPHQYMASTSKY